MPQTVRTMNIPNATWSLHRDTIIKLYLDNRRQLKEVANIMKVEHGLEATVSQYEAQFRHWKIRRNLKLPEWRRIFGVIDGLPPETKKRVILCGRVVDEKTIHRARRNCNSKPTTVEEDANIDDPLFDNPTSGASIEIQKPDGTWRQFPEELLADRILALPEVASDQMIGFHDSPTQILPLHTLVGTFSAPDDIENDLLDNNFHQCSMDNTSLIWSPSKFTNPALPTPELGPSEPLLINPYFGGPYMWLWDLSSREIDGQLASWRIHPFAVQNGFMKQLEHARTSDNNYEPGYQEYARAEYYLQSLRALVPGALPPNLGNGMVAIDSGENATEKSVIQGLMFSIANAWAGLTKIPIGSVLLALSPTSSTLLIRFLGSRPCHLTKAIAESLFRAAIENGNNSVLREIVDTELVDVNRVVIFNNGEKYTAIERVWSLHNLTGMKIILNAKADLTRILHPYDIAVYYFKTDCIDETWLSFYSLIRQHNPEAIREWEVRKTNTRLNMMNEPVPWTIDAIRLSPTLFSPLDHSKVVGLGIMCSIAREMEDPEALSIVRQFHQICQQTGCGRCFNQRNLLHNTFIVSIIHGRCELAKFLLPLCSGECVLAALSISIRLRHKDLITIILDKMKDFGYEIDHKFDDKGWSNITHRLTYFPEDCQLMLDDLLHPLAEALLSNDTLLVSSLETAGAFWSLSKTGFEDVLAAAIEMNCIDYVQRLLDNYPTTDGSSLAIALFIAIQKGFDDISYKLLGLGATSTRVEKSINANVTYCGLPLNAALRRKNFQLAYAILLDTDIETGAINFDTFQAILDSGDMSMFTEILRFIPNIMSTIQPASEFREGCRLLSSLYKAKRYDILDVFVSQPTMSAIVWSWCFSAIESDDITLVEFLLSRRMIKLDESTLGRVAKIGNTTILRLLLQEAERQAMSASIPFPLTEAISDDGRISFECLDILLSSPIFHLGLHPGGTPLSRAISMVENEPDIAHDVVKRLLDAGSDVNGITSYSKFDKRYISQTALLEAIDHGNERLVRLLIDRGANANAPVYMTIKQTPLQKAAEVGNLAIVRLLLEHNVDVNARPSARTGGTALQYAAISGNCNIAAELLSRGALLHTRPGITSGRWPIEGAAEHGRLHMIEYLWIAKENTAFPENCDSGFEEKYCRRAMELAEENGHMACRDLIAEKAGLSVGDN
ncbi:uncharacterized protein F4812DRAFT_465103 [Daldinia caldariorum]|uniref:uncharacterized protein n=1 Tax=Daldinia caldariorum TaxID=326644 RepID=UPI0020083845|nr:uncharacterized protein F4812DRAFT_465103 [Daldinia caldariorum]KAI1473208.1 hypothetical protein F4812DRAFT_465103 [Daldinia caldariorum]